MTFDDEFDSYDPVVAERFTLLDRATMPDRDGSPVSPVGAPVVGIDVGRYRPWRHLAAAAAVALVAGASVVAVAKRGEQQDVEASTGDNPSIAADQGPAPEGGKDEPKSLTVEVPGPEGQSSYAATTGGDAEDEAGAGDDPSDGGSADGADSTTTTIASNPDESDDGSRASGVERTTGSTEAPEPSTTDQSRPATTATPTTTVLATVRTTTTRDLVPGSSWLNPPTPEKMITIRGQVTEVFTDCMSRLVLNEAGEVESIGPVSCDGGSYIIVNGTRIQTTSGFTAEDDSFGKHPESLRPGQTVKVSAVPTGANGQLMTLDCVLCGVQLSG